MAAIPLAIGGAVIAGVATKHSIEDEKKEFSIYKNERSTKDERGHYVPKNANEGDRILENEEYGWYNPAGWFGNDRHELNPREKREAKELEKLPEIESFVCPITKKSIIQPASTCYGHLFELSAIKQWVQENNSCPVTKKPLRLNQIFPQ